MNDYIRTLLLLPAIIFFSACSNEPAPQSGTEVRIINGSPVDQIASPQIVRLDITLPDGSPAICSGTVISSTRVLTAGHCFAQGALAASVSGATGTIPAASYIVHPGYTENIELLAIFNDIAIVETSSPLNLPALGILASRPIESGESFGIWGYGLDEDGAFGTLKMGSMNVEWASPNHIAALFESGANTCSGDSGGPATAALTDDSGTVIAVGIVGITSSGLKPDCSEGDLSLFANVQSPEALSFISAAAPDAVIF